MCVWGGGINVVLFNKQKGLHYRIVRIGNKNTGYLMEIYNAEVHCGRLYTTLTHTPSTGIPSTGLALSGLFAQFTVCNVFALSVS